MRRARGIRLLLVHAVVVLLSWTACVAAEPANETTGDKKRCELEVLPYAWIPSNFGTVEVRGRTSHVDVSVKDALDLATSGNAFTAAGYFEFRWDRLFAYLDGFGGYVDERVRKTAPLPALASRPSASMQSSTSRRRSTGRTR